MTSRIIKLSTGIFLAMFMLAVLSLVFLSTADPQNPNIILFTTALFAGMLIIGAVVYIMNFEEFSSVSQHMLIVLAIVILCASLSFFVLNLKYSFDIKAHQSDIEYIAAMDRYYLDYSNSLVNQTMQITLANRELAKDIENLSSKVGESPKDQAAGIEPIYDDDEEGEEYE